MKKFFLVARKAFTDSTTTVVAGSIAVFAIMLLHIVVYPEYGGVQSMQYPEALSGLFGEAGSIGLIEGYITAVATNCLALVAVLAVIMGSGATAGEEAAGTLDLMLAQPVRRHVFALAKACGLAFALVVMTMAAVPAFLLGNLRADMSVTALDFFAVSASSIPPALIFLGIALLAGATLASRGAATTVAAGAVVVAYFVHAAGAIGPLETVRKISPFYWSDASHVLFDGFDWLRSLSLLAIAIGLFVLAAYALRKRDIAAGRRESKPLLTRVFRSGATSITAGNAGKLGGHYSKAFGVARKTISDIRWTVFSASFAAFAFALLLVLIYPSYRDALKDFEYPGALKGLLGEAGSFASPQGYMSGEFFGFMPLILIAIAIILGTGATAGEEVAGTLDIVLSQPIKRRTLLIQKAVPIALGIAVAAGAGLPGFLLGTLFSEMDLSVARFIAATVTTTLLAILFLSLALWAGATLPSRGAAAMFSTAAVVFGYLLNTLSFTIEWLQTPNKFSPFYWADGSHALVSGFDWIRVLALVATSAALFLLAVRSLERRDVVVGRRDWGLLRAWKHRAQPGRAG